MAIQLSDNLLARTTAPGDAKWGPYTGADLSTATSVATTFLISSYRYEGLTVGLKIGSNPIVEYWFSGGVADGNLVLKPNAGSSGANGTSGSSGTSGANGASGSAGTSGADGTSGSAGSSGVNGTSGSAGTSGADGTSGSAGSSGVNGTSGSAGSSGVNGTSGSAGSSGVNGTSGSAGTSGADGTSGSSGANGASGSAGSSGANGTSGSAGSSGVNGASGSAGSSGANGTDGSSGTSGSSGNSITNVKTFGCVIDGGGNTITTGIKTDVVIPYNFTVTSWTMIADQSGSIVIDIWSSSYASAPPTVTNTITGSALPTLSSVAKNQSSTLSGWTTLINSGSVVRFNVNSASTVTKVTLSISGTIS